MPLSMVIPDANFTKYVAVSQVPQAGLIGDFRFGGDESASAHNHAPGGGSALVDSSSQGILYYSDYMEVPEGTAPRWASSIDETDSFTVVGAYRSFGAAPRFFTSESASPYSWAIISGNGLLYGAIDNTDPNETELTSSVYEAPMIVALRCDTAGDGTYTARLDTFTASGGVSLVGSGTVRVNGGGDWQIGRGGVGALQAHGLIIYNRSTTDQELLDVRAVMGGRYGI